MITRRHLMVIGLPILACILLAGCAWQEQIGLSVELRAAVISATTPLEKATAYEKLFTDVGLSHLSELIADDDTGLALQAAWEINKVQVQRSVPIRGRSEWTLDHASVEQFVDFLEERTQTKVPNWWKESLLDSDLFPGQHIAFSNSTIQEYHSTDWLAALDDTSIEKHGADLIISVSADSVTVVLAEKHVRSIISKIWSRIAGL